MDINPDVLSILVGINDINRYLHGDRTSPFDFDAWDKKYRELLDRARQENPNLKIVLASPFVAPTGNMSENKDFRKYDKIVERCSAIVEEIARDYKAVYLPYRQMFNDLLQRDPTSQNTYWIWDGVHPTAAGHQRMPICGSGRWTGKKSFFLNDSAHTKGSGSIEPGKTRNKNIRMENF